MLCSFSSLVCLLRGRELVQLPLDHVVLDLLEEELGFADRMACRNKVHRTEALPAELLHGKHPEDLLRREGHEGLDGDGRIGRDLEGDVEDRFDPCTVTLDDLPRLRVSEVLVTDAGDVHGILQRLAEVVVLDVALERAAHGGHLGDRGTVVVVQLAAGGHLAVAILLRQHEGPIDEITQHGDQFVVVAGLEILPRKVVVLRLGALAQST